jgi:hypothetical protein
MKLSLILAGIAGLSAMLAVADARAQPTDVPSESVAGGKVSPRAPSDAVELKVGFDYAQAFGGIGTGLPSLSDLGYAGGGFQVGVGYRLDPHLMIGVYGSADQFSHGRSVDTSASLYSATGGIEVNWHLMPREEWDPYLGLGTGWRGYWVGMDRGTTSLNGWQIARADLGVDIRFSQGVAIAPVMGIDLSTFFTQELAGQTGFYNVGTPELNTFVYAGILGRFDIPSGASPSGRTAQR